MKWSEVDDLTRTQLEEGADFLGLIIMQNLVKKETYGAIAELHAAFVVRDLDAPPHENVLGGMVGELC